MTSQPLVASFYVDYLSHPLSSEHLLVCYQQITRQIAHAPVSAKDAAISFQHQSQAMIELLGQYQTLALPQTKERPAPVGCQSQLKRMQNALWRRSSQSSLAKDVALVRPESLNWQKECDVLWLYGPFYNAAQPANKQCSQSAYDGTTTHSHPPSLPGSPLNCNVHVESLAITSPAKETTKPAIDMTVGDEKMPDQPLSPTLEAQSSHAPSSLLSSPPPELVSSDAVVVINTVGSPSLSDTPKTTVVHSVPTDLSSGVDALSLAKSSAASLHINTSAAAVKNSIPSSSSPLDENPPSRPQKSALKQLGTMTQTFEELRSFTQTPQYLALTKALESLSLTTPASEGSLTTIAEGTCSEPVSPMIGSSDNSSSGFLLPIFPAPTKYHFRSYDRRRASFPKSSSHPSQLNLNINLNMDMPIPSGAIPGRRATIGGSNRTSVGHHHHGGRLIPSSTKQLRFSLEVQELIFLPTSPPFRISRAKPTRAHSDPAIQSASCSSFIAPQSRGHPQDGARLSPALRRSLHRAGLISSSTASAASFENTTTFIKVQASSSSRNAKSRSEYDFNDDDFFENCLDLGGNSSTITEEECDIRDDEYDFDDEDDDLLDDDEEYDEFNGLGQKRISGNRYRRRSHAVSRRYRRLSEDNAIVARKTAEPDATNSTKATGPGVLWQVYTAVTGVRELIAWYGSM
ncbi:hypothetical protein FBU30_009490, partial [Linnemannia zychae]